MHAVDAAHDQCPVIDLDPDEPAEYAGGKTKRGIPEERYPKERPLTVVRRVHRNLGHCANDQLVRMLQLSGHSLETRRLAKNYKCPVCAERAAPPRPQVASSRIPSGRFNESVQLDLKMVHSIDNKGFWALSMLCEDTLYHRAVLIPCKEAAVVAEAFLHHWLEIFGPPKMLTVDQGKEWESDFCNMMERMGKYVTFVGARSPWQLGTAERHGGTLGDIVSVLVKEIDAKTEAEMACVLGAAAHAKNARVGTHGFSPEEIVFGQRMTMDMEVYPDSDEDQSNDPTGIIRSTKLRAEAVKALQQQVAKNEAVQGPQAQEQ